jgi:hypothetical protein
MRLLKPNDSKIWHDDDSDSDMFLYNGGLEWGAYMTRTTKEARRTRWHGKGFKGTIDWAVDLQAFTSDDSLGYN